MTVKILLRIRFHMGDQLSFGVSVGVEGVFSRTKWVNVVCAALTARLNPSFFLGAKRSE